MFDPLDGSSNIDVNACIGTIFSIHHKITKDHEDGSLEDCLQKGSDQIAAGYFIYGPSTIMGFTTRNHVHGFTLAPTIGRFFFSHPKIPTPAPRKNYTIKPRYMHFSDTLTRTYIY